ncbi:hypothetical protein FQN50_003355 [Emmonsiellopsis sp. PD_5]|nr:hypothetical protein FQN50_003355 [Emmonsiellopsis sp. PD_5]
MAFHYVVSSSDDDSYIGERRVRRHARPRDKVDMLEVPMRRGRAASVGNRGRDGNIIIVNEHRSPSRERSHSHVRTRPKVRILGDEDEFEEMEERMERMRLHRRPRSHSPHVDLDHHLMEERLRQLERRDDNMKLEEQIRELRREQERRQLEIERERERLHRGDRNDRHDRGDRADRAERVSRRELEREMQLEKLRMMEEEQEARIMIQRAIEDKLRHEDNEKKLQKEQEKKIREKIAAEKAKQEAEEQEQKERDEKLKKQAIEEYNKREMEKKLKEKKEKEKADKEFEERATATLAKAGYNEEQIKAILKGEKDKSKAIARPGPQGKPTFIKVHSHHISPDTLDAYKLPWEYDDRDQNFVVIRQWISDEMQEALFEHTRQLRQEQKLLIAPSPPSPRPASRVGVRDEMYLVRAARKKSPRRASGWLW